MIEAGKLGAEQRKRKDGQKSRQKKKQDKYLKVISFNYNQKREDQGNILCVVHYFFKQTCM